MSYRIVAALALLAFAAVAEAGNSSLKLPSFDHLESKAVESVDVTFGRVPIRLAGWFIGDEDPDSAHVKQMLKSIRSLSVRHYRFASDFVYSMKDLDAVRSQLQDKGWSQVVQVRDRKKDEDVDVFISLEDEQVTGIAVVASEPREFTIVNIVGNMDLDQVESWRAHFESHGKRDWFPSHRGSGRNKPGRHAPDEYTPGPDTPGEYTAEDLIADRHTAGL